MTPKECWEKYRHLDHLLSDSEWLPKEFQGYMLFDCWQAVKQAAKEETK
jgi:hypothetical protein